MQFSICSFISMNICWTGCWCKFSGNLIFPVWWNFFPIFSYIIFTYGMKFRTHSSISRYGTRKPRGWRGEVRWSFPGCFCTSLWILHKSKCIYMYIYVRYFYRHSVSLNSLCYANNQQNQYCDESYYSMAEWSVRHQTRWKRRNQWRIQEFKKRGGGVQARYNFFF